MRVLTLVIACAVVNTGPAGLADTHYVADDGQNTFPYTNWADAATSIQSAVDAADSNDVVLVASGEYRVFEQVCVSNAVVLRSSEGAAGTVIDAQDVTRCLAVNCRNAEVNGFTFRHGSHRDIGGAVFMQGGTLANCIIAHSAAPDGGGLFVCDSGVIRECLVYQNSAAGGGGVSSMGDVTIVNCKIFINAAAVGGGMSCRFGATEGAPVISNCTIVWNNAELAGGVSFATTEIGIDPVPSPLVLNSIVYFNNASTYPDTANYYSEFDYALFRASCTTPFPRPLDGLTITNDPQLTKSCRLRSTSPCIDAGLSSDAPATDIDGEARWDHPGHSNAVSIVDIGADEFVDTDLDHMADYWEVDRLGSVTNSDGNGDGDLDDLTDLGEYEHGTDPRDPDTDDDRMLDGSETAADTDPLDSNSWLGITGIAREEGEVRITWQGGQDVTQVLEWRTDLPAVSDTWTAVRTVAPPTPVTNSVLQSVSTNSVGYYRIRVVE